VLNQINTPTRNDFLTLTNSESGKTTTFSSRNR